MLHHNQCYLGRCVLWCKRDNVIDFLDMTDDEKKEFLEVAKTVRDSLRKIWQPDLMNYSSLANVTLHLHVHIIPRYKNKRAFYNYEFVDKRWGKNPAPYDKEFSISEDLLIKIKVEIQKNISS